MMSFLTFLILYFITESFNALTQNAKCYPNQPQCSFSQQFAVIHNEKGNEPISWSDAKQRCQDTYGEQSTLAYLDPSISDIIPIAEQFKAMKKLCKLESYKYPGRNYWIGGYRSTDDKNIWYFNGNTKQTNNNDDNNNNNNDVVFTLYRDNEKNLKLYDILNTVPVRASMDNDNNNNMNNDDINMYDTSFNFWSCDPVHHNQCEPDDRIIKGELDENCLALYNAREYNISDWNCNGGNKNNQIYDLIVSDIVCTNPDFDPSKRCQCDCDVCYIHGDPHVQTFDNTYYHPMGNCTYNYVTPCFYNEFDEFFPFDISGSHEKCFNSDMSCLQSLYVTIYDPEYFKTNNKPALRLELSHLLMDSMMDDNGNNGGEQKWRTVAKYFQCNECKMNNKAGNDVEMNKDIIFYENKAKPNEPWLFRLERSEDNKYLVLRFYGKLEWEQFRIEFRDITNVEKDFLHLSDAKIYISQCLLTKSCGLCGYYDGHQKNDFVIRRDEGNNANYQNGMPDFKNYIKNDHSDDLKDLAAFERTQEFSHFWKNDNEEFMDIDKNCGKSELCHFDDFIGFCPNECECIDGNGQNVPASTLNNNLPSLRSACAIDMCACIGMEADEIDEIFNVQQMLGMSTQELFDTVNRDLNFDNNHELIVEFLTLIGKLHCMDIPNNYCCNPIYCPFPLQFPGYCLQNIPTPFPTPQPTKGETIVSAPTQMNHWWTNNAWDNGQPVIDTLPVTQSPTPMPTEKPTNRPTDRPTDRPTQRPTEKPTERPTERPTNRPTERPTQRPTNRPTNRPTPLPTPLPTDRPTNRPTNRPTPLPTPLPTNRPTNRPTTAQPTNRPTNRPTTAQPTNRPTYRPTTAQPTNRPTNRPTTMKPTERPSEQPIQIVRETDQPQLWWYTSNNGGRFPVNNRKNKKNNGE